MKKLTAAEEQIMQHLWEMKEATVSQIITQMNKPNIPHSSISSIVRILEKKGFVDHKAFGRTYLYFPIVQKENYSKKNIQSLVENYFEGSMESLVSFLVNEKQLDTKELKNLIKELESKNQKT